MEDGKETKMTKVKRLWMVVLLVAALMTTVVGVAGARPNSSPHHGPLVVMTIPAGYFNPMNNTCAYVNSGAGLWMTAGGCGFYAPVNFPGQATTGYHSAQVKALVMWVTDNSANDVTLTLFKIDPTTAGVVTMAHVTSIGQVPGIRSFGDTTIVGNPLFRGHAPILRVAINGPGPVFHGGRIQYVFG